MHLETHFDVERPREEAVAIATRDDTLQNLFPDSRTEVVAADGRRKTTRTHYTALGRSGVATFHFDFREDGRVDFEKVCDGRVWRELKGTLRFSERGGGTRVRIAMEGRTKGFVPEFAIKAPMQDQMDQMARALRRQLEQAPQARAARRSRAESDEQAPQARAARRSRAKSDEQAPQARAARRSRAKSDEPGR